MTEEKYFDLNFDHSKAYEEDMPMGKALKHLNELAEENGCPLLIACCTSKTDESSTFIVRQNVRPLENSMYNPEIFALAQAVWGLDQEDQKLIEIMLVLIDKAKATDAKMLEMIQDQLGNSIEGAENLLREIPDNAH